MLNVTELRSGTIFKEDGNLWQVLTYEHNKMGRGSGTIKVKVKNLKGGSITEKSFITGARVDEGNVEKKSASYLYQDGESFIFMDPQSFEQFPLAAEVVGDQAKYLKDGLDVSLLVADGEALGLEIPNSLIYEITETGPGEKGNTVSNVFKSAVVDNGMEVKVPMFAKVGDKVKIDTRTGQYLERVK
ncbi:elongation factor P [Patescibacteria group bacterium]|nr:elongation factor P [Patescibacteria group bacterium]MCL5409694.1 elongation factor P [Patescibacteria group bacterium]